MGALYGTGDGAPALRRFGEGELAALAGYGQGPQPEPGGLPRERAREAEAAAREEVLAALRSWGGSTEPGERDPALRKVWIRDWLKLLDERRPPISEAVDEIAGLASGPWWR